ncbi:MAG: Fic family protein [Planctomycetota bacterium]
MSYIHQLDHWPDLAWDASALAEALASARHRQGRLLGAMDSLGLPHRSEAAVEAMTSELVRSWAIEGEALDEDAVRSSLANRLGIDDGGLPAASRDVEGLVELMLDVAREAAAPLTAKRLHSWHGALFPTGRSGLRSIQVGAWRRAEVDPMQVVSGRIGRERVHFEAPAAARVASEMRTFLTWFESAKAAALDPVLRAGVAHLWFLTVHPYEDGNGRIGRAIADLALARGDGTRERYYSLSAQIEAERSDYYDALESAQKGALDITDWLAWFLGCLERAIERSERAVERVRRSAEVWSRAAAHALNERQRKLITLLLGDFRGKMTSSKAAKLTGVSSDTALRDLNALVAAGLFRRGEAGGRSVSYELAP